MQYNSLSEKAYYMVKEMIATCEKGHYLSMRDVAQQFGMSYTPVREAFQKLKNEGLLELEPNVGYFVPKMDIQDLMRIYQARECVEPYVFEGAFDLLAKPDVDILKDCIRKQKLYLSQKNIKEYLKEDERFHRVFFDAFNNPYLTDIVKTVRAKYLVCSKSIGHGSDIATGQHEKIVELIEQGRKEEAVQLLKEHIVAAKLRMMEGFISYNR
ncbi:MAG TPA: GntR family transcriptional regulator [Bacillota bacterium]|nr:GntR family transcriptional regulator [Bacillota bacterium]HOG52858.1 GntR family transcriptional regulator [Bacillota bacterium]